MVCLVATAVSFKSNLLLSSTLNQFFEIYAAFYEWRTGERQDIEFTSSTFLDVYTGNVNSLKYIQESRLEAYHSALTNIYTLARCVVVLSGKLSTADWTSSASPTGTVGTAIAPINIDELE
jgi:hypothetical protein